MDFQALAALYTTKTDEELLELASQPEQLTLEAQSALRSEMGKRRLDFEKLPVSIAPAPMDVTSGKKVRATEPLVTQPVGEFIADVFRFYRRNRWTYFALVFPAVAVGTMAVLIGKHEARELERHLPHGREILRHPLEIAEIGFATWSGFFVSWIASCFSYGAVCALFEQVYSGFRASIRDSFSAIREQWGPLLRVSLLLWASLLILGFLGLAVDSILLYVAPHITLAGISLGYVLSYSVLAVAALILSRFALSIPAVVLDDYPAGRAMFRSDELTDCKWTIISVLLFKSIIGGYIAGMVPFWLAGWLFRGAYIPWWFSWVLTGASILAVSWVEPIMFIGFALLYEKTCGRDSTTAFQTDTRAAVLSS